MKKLLAAIVLTAGLSLGAQISLGFRIGPPPTPRVERVRPPAPGPDYFWVDGYWYPEGNRYRWHEGYWTRAPYAGSRCRGMKVECFLKAIGTATADGLRTTTVGIVITTATSATTGTGVN